MRTTKALTGFINRIGTLAILLVAFTTISFAEDIAEEELRVEAWMITPFYGSIYEEELVLEPWMTTPFEVADCQVLACCN